MRKLIVALLVMVGAGVANAQYAAPPPQQPYYGPPAYYQQPRPMQVQLTVDEQWLLSRGYISDGEHLGGGIIAVMFGFGVGQAVQGRWSEKGYIFTFGELASFGAMMYGMVELITACDYNSDYGDTCNHAQEQRGGVMLAGGAIAVGVFRIWEIVDAFAGPAEHNRKVHDLHMRLGIPDRYAHRAVPYVAPAGDGGGVAGVALRF